MLDLNVAQYLVYSWIGNAKNVQRYHPMKQSGTPMKVRRKLQKPFKLFKGHRP